VGGGGDADNGSTLANPIAKSTTPKDPIVNLFMIILR